MNKTKNEPNRTIVLLFNDDTKCNNHEQSVGVIEKKATQQRTIDSHALPVSKEMV